MKSRNSRVLLTAAASGGGKTTVTCGILKALLNRRIPCRAFKCGPDYIDPMFHKYVLGIDGGNLDTWFQSEDAVRRRLADEVPEGGCTVIEGVMGFYDGVAGLSTQASAYDVARATETPVILILDARGASLSLAAVLKGFLEYRNDSHIRGVILNRTTRTMADRLTPVLEELGVVVAGYIPECGEARLESRHLGLVMPEEVKALHGRLERLAELLEETIDMEKVLAIADEAPELDMGRLSVHAEAESKPGEPGADEKKLSAFQPLPAPVRIAVARDPAFCFYYQENLALLEQLGAVLVPFSPMNDRELPTDIDGLLLGGGYPENYGAALEANVSMRRQIREKVEDGLPVLAECGGFLYLHESLEGSDGKTYHMAGVIAAHGYRTKRLGRFGYIEMEAQAGSLCLPKGEHIRGHEFHYWDSTASGGDWMAQKPLSTRNWACVHDKKGMIAGFPHLYYPSNPAFLERWIGICRERKENGQ